MRVVVVGRRGTGGELRGFEWVNRVDARSADGQRGRSGWEVLSG